MPWTTHAAQVNLNGMSITRGEFLKSLRKSIPGMVLGSGAVVAANKILNKMAAVSNTPEATEIPQTAPQPKSTPDAKIDFITRGPTDGNQIALTFDDGPTPGVTDRILDELMLRNLPATFFMIGQRIAAAPELARRVLAEGHEIANHTFTHPKLTDLPPAQVEAEIQKTEDIMLEVLNHRARWLRPPYGALRQNQAGIMAKKGLGIVLWSVDPEDWSQPGEEKIMGTILAETKPGSIIVCHDMHLQTANALDRVLDGLLQRGFTFVTLSSLLARR